MKNIKINLSTVTNKENMQSIIIWNMADPFQKQFVQLDIQIDIRYHCGYKRMLKDIILDQSLNLQKQVYTEDEKKEAVIHTEIREKLVNDIAEDYGVTRVTLYKWKEELLGSESECTMKKQDQDTITNRPTSEETDQLKQEVERLRKEVYPLQLEKDILEKAAQIIKKEKGINLNELINKEKIILIDAIKEKYPLKELLIELKISKSSYFYQENAMKLGDKYS